MFKGDSLVLTEDPTMTPPTTEASTAESFESLDQTLEASGPAAAVDQLIGDLQQRKSYRPLLDALLLKARLELGLPLIPGKSTSNWPEPIKTAYEDRYVESIREVGSMLLNSGDIAGAWPYFRAIAEPAPIAKAIDEFETDGSDDRLHGIVEVAFNQGANPGKGFALSLKHYGTCSAVTAFEHLPREEAVRSTAADRLVRQVHEHLVGNLRNEIESRGQPLPPPGTSIPNLMKGRDWLFADEAYHIDVSHLAATVRVGPLLQDLATMALALELAEYGVRLSPKHSYEGDPPFEKVSDDHAVYFRVVLGIDVDAGIEHFRSKLSEEHPTSPESEISTDDLTIAQVLIALLARLGRPGEALKLASQYLGGVPDSSLFCPGIAQLAEEAGEADLLAQVARRNGDLVQYAMAILRSKTDKK